MEYWAAPDFIMSVEDIKFEDNYFDVVLGNHVLEHVRDDNKAMREIYRVLKKSGYAILQVPINIKSKATLEDPSLSPEERAAFYGYADHLRYYGLDYKDRLKDNGFIVQLDSYVKELNIDRYALDKNEVIYLCYKEK
jgi:SAM-dependent methyltransferase